MGLAASQARFLGITLRKANCEFKSTQLAEQRLRISNQLSDISQEYSNAMNATKLMWCSDIANDDYAINYNLLMLPSAMNDYDPYFVSTKSGALLLNDKYAAAAKAAGIGVSGSVPSETQRNAFIEALAGTEGGENSITGATYDTDISIITPETADRILNGVGAGATIESPINWNRTAGMGASPENKNVLDELLLSDLIEDANIGGAKLDWLQMYTKDGVYTENEVEILERKYKSAISNAKNKYLADESHTTSTLTTLTTSLESASVVNEISMDLTMETIPYFNSSFKTNQNASNTTLNIIKQFKKLEYLIANANNTIAKERYVNELNNLKRGKNANGEDLGDPSVYGVCWAYYDYIKHRPNGAIIGWTYGTNVEEIKDSSDNIIGYRNVSEVSKEYIDRTTSTTLLTKHDSEGNVDTYKINMEDLFQTIERKIENRDDDGIKVGTTTYTTVWTEYDSRLQMAMSGVISHGSKEKAEQMLREAYSEEEIAAMKANVIDTNHEITEDLYTSNLGYQMTVLKNGVIRYDEKSLKNMTIADLLTDDIVIMNWWHDQEYPQDAIQEMSYRVTKLLEYIAGIFGYGNIGTGLNVDDSTDTALTKAFETVKKKYLKTGNAIMVGGEWSESNPTACSVYKNANDYNRIGADEDGNTAAVNLSNLVSAFLTYYDNYLTNSTEEYYVGKANDDTNGSKTYFVTDDANYTYYTVDPEQMSDTEKIASFYDELYNNLCARGWRVDGQLDQPDYLEHMIKDGRYQLMSLNKDGYYYQTRYSQTGYLKEVTDEEAITRAEAEYTRKKADLTYKEDLIDMKSKNLDAEIAELNTELNSVQNMISKSIEKTFNMFQT